MWEDEEPSMALNKTVERWSGEEKPSPPLARGENRPKQRETANVLKQLMTTQTAGRRLLPAN